MNRPRLRMAMFVGVSFLPLWTPASNNASAQGQTQTLQENFDRFPLISPKYDEHRRPQFVRLSLNKDPFLIDGKRFDGLRFQANRHAQAAF